MSCVWPKHFKHVFDATWPCRPPPLADKLARLVKRLGEPLVSAVVPAELDGELARVGFAPLDTVSPEDRRGAICRTGATWPRRRPTSLSLSTNGQARSEPEQPVALDSEAHIELGGRPLAIERRRRSAGADTQYPRTARASLSCRAPAPGFWFSWRR